MVPDFIRSVASYISEENGETNFNMKVKSGEGCGAVGRNECMICHGVAVLSRYNWDQAEQITIVAEAIHTYIRYGGYRDGKKEYKDKFVEFRASRRHDCMSPVTAR
jgi:hypothetical protein